MSDEIPCNLWFDVLDRSATLDAVAGRFHFNRGFCVACYRAGDRLLESMLAAGL